MKFPRLSRGTLSVVIGMAAFAVGAFLVHNTTRDGVPESARKSADTAFRAYCAEHKELLWQFDLDHVPFAFHDGAYFFTYDLAPGYFTRPSSGPNKYQVVVPQAGGAPTVHPL